MIDFPIPHAAAAILRRLERAGYEAWAVGGCVRDSLLGLSPKDWDVCTSALPDQVISALHGWKVLPTGLRHGTVTVLLDGAGWEVTTYRADGGYSDHRHPDQVRFLSRIEGDLARRDFTVNAMAWHPGRGLLDPMGGRRDLEDRVLRCVGGPARRFDEDALRILRGVRFAAWYALSPHPDTAAAIHRQKGTLAAVAPERCFAELRRLLCAPESGLEMALREFWDVLAVLPGLDCLGPMAGYDQRNPHHSLDLRDHTVRAVVSVPPEERLRLAALLHDAGKPACRTLDGEGIAHYYGHAARGAQLADAALGALRCPGKLRRQVVDLVERHDLWVPPTPAAARRWLGRLGEGPLRDLLALERADTLAHAPDCQPPRLARLAEWESLLDRVLAEDSCFSLRDLAVKGGDILALGIPAGPPVGETLRWLLGEVMEGRLANEREALLRAAGARRKGDPSAPNL